MGGSKDSGIEQLWAGIILPSAILVLALFNLITGRVYWLAGRSRVPSDHRVFIFQVFWDGWHVTGTILFKLGIAGALVAWFLMANHTETERFARPCLIGSIVVAVTGFAIHAIGYFRYGAWRDGN